jgi:acetyl-CoA acetyltransferase
VRLTTNIVNCDPADVFVGMKVRVQFEHSEDVWVPVFEPTGDPEKGPFPTVDETSRMARPMPKGAKKFEDAVAITGIGMSRVGRRLMVDPIVLTVDACKQAIADAGLEPADIDGLSTYPGVGVGAGMSEGGIFALEEVLRLRPLWINSGLELPGQGGSVIAAMLAVAGGLCNHVLCFRTVWEATYAARQRAAMNERARTGMLALQESRRVSGDAQWRQTYGASSAANWIAMQASAHFDRFGTTKETLGWIALNARKNAARTPWAIYKEPLTMDDYLDARMITTPFGLYDCDVPCDGAVAVIVSRKELAADLAQPAVHLEAVGTAITERISWDQGTLDHEPLVQGPAAHLWTRTDLKPGDIDMAQLYDGFSFNCLSWIEALGFCGWGEAKDFLDRGTNIALDGPLPLNTHGGQLSSGRLHGFGFIHEAVTQLRGQAGERQVAEAETAIVSNGGGAPGGVFLFTTAR